MKTIRLLITLVIFVSAQLVNGQQAKVDVEKSKIVWVGNKVGGSHTGDIKLKSGVLEVTGDKIVSGNFVVDMNSITNADVQDKGYNQKLVGHLKSDDFFGVEKFPTSTLTVKSSTKFQNDKASVTGSITIKGKTEDISFEVTRSGNTYASRIEIDRSKFDVRYGSKSFFDNLGDKVIDNIFILEVKLVI